MSELKKVSLFKILLPAFIGLGVVGYMIITEWENTDFSALNFTFKSLFFLSLAFLFMFGRDFGYLWRIRLFSDKQLTWKQAFRVIMLWEFTSAVTPSTVGGTAVAVVFVHKEGLSVGKSAAMVMLTAFFDELFFVIAFPLIILLTGSAKLFAFENASSLIYLIMTGLTLKLVLVIILSYGLFFNPKGLKWMITKLFSLPFLRKWKEDARKTGDDIILSSREIKKYKRPFWIKAFVATSLSWISRFLVANAIFMAFFAISDHLLVFARQLAMWIPMIISPTPGGSGFAEYIFQNFLSDVLPSASNATLIPLIALFWRGVTYFPYLIIGAMIIPKWLNQKFHKPRIYAQNERNLPSQNR